MNQSDEKNLHLQRYFKKSSSELFFSPMKLIVFSKRISSKFFPIVIFFQITLTERIYSDEKKVKKKKGMIPVFFIFHFSSFLRYGFVQVTVRVDFTRSREVVIILAVYEFHFNVVLVISLCQSVLPQLKKTKKISFLFPFCALSVIIIGNSR